MEHISLVFYTSEIRPCMLITGYTCYNLAIYLDCSDSGIFRASMACFAVSFIVSIILLIFSYIYYLAGGVRYLFFILYSTIVVYLFGLAIDRMQQKNTEAKVQKRVITFGVLLSFLMLGIVKYAGFFVDTFNSLSGLNIPGIKEHVASLTTINTPHRGCEFADYLLSKIPQGQKDALANAYNAALKRLGDHDPNFIEAVTDLTASACKKRNEELADVYGVYYQSVGSKLNVAGNGRFPLNFSYHLVNAFDGANDGLVGYKSFEWGEDYQLLTVKGKRGISHGDVIDLNRENFDGFDVREFYVQLVAKLKNKGF